MKRAALSLIAAALAIATLAGCGEKSQALNPSSSKPDQKPWQGEPTQYTASGWDKDKKGDKAKWENQIRARGQNQNEYVKTN